MRRPAAGRERAVAAGCSHSPAAEVRGVFEGLLCLSLLNRSATAVLRSIMNLTIGEGMTGEVVLEDEEFRVSPHTGRSLRNGTIRIRVERKYDALMAGLPGRVLDSDEGRWLVLRRPQHSYRDGSRVAEHVFEIEEFENRTATMLRIADLELKPEKYYEDAPRDEGVEINARVALTDPKQIERLREILAAEEPVPVIREGVQGTPRPMRISVLGWSVEGAEQVFEVECKDPDTRKPGRLNGWNWTMGNAATSAYLVEWRIALSAILIEKGVVTKEEIAQVDEAALKSVGQRRIKFVQVDDVRQHPFKGEPEE
jgi:hypothetical protein